MTEVKKPPRPRSVAPSPKRGRDRDRNHRDASPGSRAARKDAGARRGRSLSPAPTTTTANKPKAMPPSYYDYGADQIVKHQDDDSFLEKVQRCIPSEFLVIASQDDVSKAQEDYFAMDHFGLKPPEGKLRWLNSELAGSVATCALLQLMQENPDRWVATGSKSNEIQPYSTLEILQEIQTRIKKCSKQDANPTITSSRPLGPPRFEECVFAPFYIVPPTHTKGTRRALLIACVSGEEKDLKGTINDVNNIQNFLTLHCGFKPENMTVLQETYKRPMSEQPTKKNITEAFKKMVEESKPGDVNFIQFSGHGNRSDTNLYILPSDYKTAGNIQDERLLKNLIKAMPAGVYTTFLCDCCFSGMIGDLPYILQADSTDQAIETSFDTSVTKTKKPRPKPKVQQSIRFYYDTDTREETLEKEAKGGEDYAKLKQARKQKNLWEQLDSKSHKLWGAAAKTAKKAGTAAVDGLDNAIEGAIEAAKSAKKKLRSVSPLRNRNKDKEKEKEKESVSLDESDDDDIPSPSSKAKTKAKTATSDSSSKRSKPPARITSSDAKATAATKPNTLDDDIPAPSAKHSKVKTPTSESSSRGNTKPSPKPNKSPIRKTKSLDASHGSAAPATAPTTAAVAKKKKVVASKEADEDEEFEEFEQAIAKADKEKKSANDSTNASSSKQERGRTKSRSKSPVKVRT